MASKILIFKTIAIKFAFLHIPGSKSFSKVGLSIFLLFVNEFHSSLTKISSSITNKNDGTNETQQTYSTNLLV